VFLERKINGRIFGEKIQHLQAIDGHKELKATVAQFGENSAGFTTLVQNHHNIDPDDAFSRVPYERGFQFLFYLEIVVGGPALFEPFFRKYILEFAGKTLVSDTFKEYFLDYFNNLEDFDKSKLSKIDWNAWFYQQGMPPVNMLDYFDNSLAVKADSLAKEWIKDGATNKTKEDLKGWSPQEIGIFLQVISENTLPQETVERMDELYDFSSSRNSDIRERWYRICIKSGVERIFPLVVSFLKEQGRMKFVRPLYRELFKHSEKGKALALKTFQEHRSYYHSIASKMLAKDLGLEN
jgi:leukotriene-A4 hydrolase